MTTTAVTPVVSTKVEEKMEKVNVSVIVDKEVAMIATLDTNKYLDLALSIADENETNRSALETAVKNYLKAQCNMVTARWSNLVKKIADTPKYRGTHTIEQVEKILVDNPKVKHVYQAAQKAVAIKKTL